MRHARTREHPRGSGARPRLHGVHLLPLIAPVCRRLVARERPALPRPIRRVGVFVNETEQQVIRTAVHYLLDYAQLHGDETPEECRRLNRILPVIKAIAVRTEADLAETQRYEGCCTALLFDTRTERFGGSGRRFDWNILNAYSGETPFLLSGGIGPGDAERLQAVRHPQLAGVDVNSLFESKPGHKECGLAATFL